MRTFLATLWLIMPAAITLPAQGLGSHWMGALEDGKYLYELSIPGTHDSAALVETARGTAKCQRLNLAEQLAAGIRYLDIRCRHINNAFAIHHGPVYQELNFGDVLASVRSFLSSNPTETVIMSIKQEYDPESNTRSFAETFTTYVNQDPALWYLGNSVPNLGEVRGKIVLLRRFNEHPYPLGRGINADNNGWPDDDTGTINGPPRIRVQDVYKVFNRGNKWDAIQALWAEAANNPTTLYLNYTSGYSPWAFGIPDIPHVSYYINPLVEEFFRNAPHRRYGVVIMDFADQTRSELIYGTNFPELVRANQARIAAPRITVAPVATAAPVGSPVTLTVAASGLPSPSFQWLWNGAPIAGATTAILHLPSLQPAEAGSYAVRVTNLGGAVTSGPALVSVGPPGAGSRLRQVSVRTLAGEGSEVLIAGFAVAGGPAGETLPVLLRAIGPSLNIMGAAGTLADPELRLHRGPTEIARNDNWSEGSGGAAIAASARTVGAFPLNAGSQDAAYASRVTTGVYTARILPVSGRGIAMIEVYDASTTAGAPRLVNLSVRARSGPGEEVLTVGLVVEGPTSRTLLFRALGPALKDYGLSEVLPDPLLQVFEGGRLLAENDNWGGRGPLAALHARAGAFPLSPSSTDASVALTLPPGAYTMQVLSKGGVAGVALAEIYEVP